MTAINSTINLLIKLLVDASFSIFIVTNLVVCVWRSIWDIQDIYLTSNLCLNYWISLLVSYLILIVVRSSQRRFYKEILYRKLSKNERDQLLGKLELKCFIILFAFANINHWRGIWCLTVYYTSNSENGMLLIGLVSFIGLCLLKRTNSLISVPFQINYDCIEVAFKVQAENLYNCDNYKTFGFLPKWQFLIFYIHEYVTDVCTIQVWRSYWEALGIYLYKDDMVKSGLACFVSGIFIYVIMYCFKRRINKALIYQHEKDTTDPCKNKLKWKCRKTILLRCSCVISSIGVVHLWRGLWLLQTHYIYPTIISASLKAIICVVLFVVPLFALLLINRASAILSRGNCKDEVFFMEKKYIVIKTLSQKLKFNKKRRNFTYSKFNRIDIKSKFDRITRLKQRIQESAIFLHLQQQQNKQQQGCLTHLNLPSSNV